MHKTNINNLKVEDFYFKNRIISISNEKGFKSIDYRFNAITKAVKYIVVSSMSKTKDFNSLVSAIEYYNKINI
jgi:hypothetical protein